MKVLFAIPAAFALAIVSGPATADVIAMPDAPATDSAPLMSVPTRGMTMADVTRKYGQPNAKSSTGGGSPQQPVINRWTYSDFTVVFERSRVINTVVPGRPPQVFNRDELVVKH